MFQRYSLYVPLKSPTLLQEICQQPFEKLRQVFKILKGRKATAANQLNLDCQPNPVSGCTATESYRYSEEPTVTSE
jgi:hypothetical protein